MTYLSACSAKSVGVMSLLVSKVSKPRRVDEMAVGVTSTQPLHRLPLLRSSPQKVTNVVIGDSSVLNAPYMVERHANYTPLVQIRGLDK